MPAQKWFRLTMATCMLTAVGCQSTATRDWKFWRPSLSAWRTDGLRDPVRTHVAYGQLQEQAGNLNDARESYKIALEEDAKSVDAILGLARLEVLGGRPKEAEKRFEQALQMAPLNVHVLEATGQFYVSQGRFDDAVKMLNRAVDADPNNKRLRFRLAVAEARSGDIRSAEQNFVQSVGVAEADYNIGVILYENGNLVQAEQRLQRAVTSKPDLVQAQQWLTEIRKEIGGGAPNGIVATQPQATGVPNPAQPVSALPQTGLNGPAGAFPGQLVAPSIPQAAASATASVAQTPNTATPISPVGPGANNPGINPTAGVLSQPPVAPLDPSRMNAAQLEQLENSMSPAEREQFRQRLRVGQLTPGTGF